MFTVYFFRKGIEFFDLKNLKRVAIETTKEKQGEFSLICTSSPTTLWYTSFLPWDTGITTYLVQLDCSSFPPQVKHTFDINLYDKRWSKDMCFIKDGDKALVVVAQSFKGLTAYNTETGQIEWSITGRLEDRKFYPEPSLQNYEGIWFSSVAADVRGHVLVGDHRNDCIYMFSSSGDYLLNLNKDGSLNMNKIRVVRWCQKTSSFMVSHREKLSNRDTVTYFTALTGEFNLTNPSD